jgi:uncharacterized protein with HEPN domain
MRSRRVAFVDEATATLGAAPDTYILAAVICPVAVVGDLSDHMVALKPSGARKVHWREMSQRSGLRDAAVRAVNEANLEHVVIVRLDASVERLERRRRLCMQRLVAELDLRGVAEIVAESRGEADDRRDVEHFVAMASHKVPGSDIRISHAPGPTNPALWAADVVAGVVSAQLQANERRPLDLRGLTVIRITP